MNRLFRFAALVLCAFASLASAQQDGMSPQLAQKLAQGTFREYLEFLAIPNDAAVPADIQKNPVVMEAYLGGV